MLNALNAVQSAARVFLAAVTEPTDVFVTLVTEPKLKKSWTGPDLRKVSVMHGIVGESYADAHLRVTGEPAPEPSARVWGQHIDGVLIEHKGGEYFDIQPESSMTYYTNADTGSLVPTAQVKPHLYARSKSEVPWATPKLVSITEFSVPVTA